MENKYYTEFENEIVKCFNHLDVLKKVLPSESFNKYILISWDGFNNEKVRPLKDKYNLTEFQCADLYLTVDKRFDEYMTFEKWAKYKC
jgi:hypothetical protein